jgi:ribosomal protein S18 acetylase RimI-like enzyme
MVETTSIQIREPRWYDWLKGFVPLTLQNVYDFCKALETHPEFRNDLGNITEDQVRLRLRLGHKCYMLEGKHDVVGFIWLATGNIFLYQINALLQLPPNVLYFENVNVASRYRGLNLANIMFNHAYSEKRKEGSVKTTALINTKNAQSLKAFTKSGFKMKYILNIYYILGVRHVISSIPYPVKFLTDNLFIWKSFLKNRIPSYKRS